MVTVQNIQTLCNYSLPVVFVLSAPTFLFVAGRAQSAADQPNNLAEGHPPL